MRANWQYHNLIRGIRILPTLVAVLFTVVLLLVVTGDNQSKQAAVLRTLKEDFITRQQAGVSMVVEQISRQVEYESGRAIQLLSQRLNDRVDKGIAVARSICANNPELPTAELQQMVLDALRPEGRDGQSGFFILDNTSHILMNSAITEVTRTDAASGRPTFSAQAEAKMRKAAAQPAGGFVRWLLFNGEESTTPEEKLSYIKHFSPFDWIIGSGEDVEQMHAELQKKLLSWLAQTYVQGTGHLFILDAKGRPLLFKEGNLVSTEIIQKDRNGLPLTWKRVSALPDGTGFLPGADGTDGDAGTRITFVKALKEWQWVIGAEVWLSEITPLLERQRKALTNRNDQELTRLLLICLLFALGLGTLAHFISSRLGSRFESYMHSLEESDRQQRQTRAELHHQERHDTLTNLPNRTLFQEHVNNHIRSDGGRMLAVASLGLDNFSRINEHYSYAMGDLVLKEVSRRFESVLRRDEMVSHYSGDEFLFCFPALTSRSEAAERIAAVHELFATPLLLDDKSITATCTSGLCLFPVEGDTAAELISKSQTVLKRAKKSSRNSVLFYDEKIKEQLDREIAIERVIEEAVDNGEFRTFYQPQIDAATGTINSVEALCRWQNEELGFVSPLEFIPIAEGNGTILHLGELILEQSCRDILSIQKIQPENTPPMGVSVNISPRQLLHPHFAERALAIVQRTGIATDSVTLEITENILIDDISTVLPVLERLQEAGFSISLDDFGTGYSSLRYLNSLPITELKIDKSFVDDVLVSAQAESLVRSIIAIGKSGNMVIVAEGVETHEQAEWLTEYDCTLLQGYCFDRPLPLEELRQKWFPPQGSSTPAADGKQGEA